MVDCTARAGFIVPFSALVIFQRTPRFYVAVPGRAGLGRASAPWWNVPWWKVPWWNVPWWNVPWWKFGNHQKTLKPPENSETARAFSGPPVAYCNVRTGVTSPPRTKKRTQLPFPSRGEWNRRIPALIESFYITKRQSPERTFFRAGIPRFGVVPQKKLTTPKKKIALAREKQQKKNPKAQKTQKTPQKSTKTPKKGEKKHPKFISRLRAKKNPVPKIN